MGITADVAKAWNEFAIQSAITSDKINTRIGGPVFYEPKNISSILCKFVKRGIAKKGKFPGFYIKLKSITCVPKKKKAKVVSVIDAFNEVARPIPNEPLLDTLTIGKSILAVIDSLKDKIIELRQELNEEKKESKVLIERIKEMQKMYCQAQQKIIELNSGKNQGLKLSDLNEFRGKLPE
jgi:hypothetical protein